MPDFDFIPNEKTHTEIAGSSFAGSALRIMLRSPTHVMFNGGGFNIWNRNERGGWHNLKKLFTAAPTIAQFEAISARVDEEYGEGVGAALLRAWRKNETVLMDGGGAPMPLPRFKQREMSKAAYEKASINWRADLAAEVQTCRQCGKGLRPDTDYHRLGAVIQPDHPRSVEDCQKLTNRRVVAVHDYGITSKGRVGYVERFETWDGESYLDQAFCGDRCAAVYGRRAARDLPALEVGVELPRREHRQRDDVEHNPAPPRYFDMPDGSTIKY